MSFKKDKRSARFKRRLSLEIFEFEADKDPKIDEYKECLKEVKQIQKISDYELDTLEYGEYEYQEVELPQVILDAAYAV